MLSKAFDGQQGKEEIPTEWLETLQKNMQQYSRIDPNSIVGQSLLKVNFVTHAWPDIKKKVEKIEDWQDKGLNELLKEVQKVHVWRDEEKAKIKAKIMIATTQESNSPRDLKPPDVVIIEMATALKSASLKTSEGSKHQYLVI
ncbi:hypothetical protein DUI87_30928 [Hirundo rustica rustica]|uniref:Core shell protein Gag P30 domain-containing protein n=1 Tax=Hirundo rustica rustica TaxID=333673 RepID=A0A3M0J1G4_HIRRU|nr:hypothetical protein DUI87_30928 [Hirundo rustica rustica]